MFSLYLKWSTSVCCGKAVGCISCFFCWGIVKEYTHESIEEIPGIKETASKARWALEAISGIEYVYFFLRIP